MRAILSVLVLGVAVFSAPTGDGVQEPVWSAVAREDGVTLSVATFHPADEPGTGEPATAADRVPLLLLAGGPGYAGETLHALARLLAEERTVHVLDQRGTGRSEIEGLGPQHRPTLTFDALVADVEAVRAGLGVERWAIAGHGWGGMLAVLYADAHPERVAGVAMISPLGADEEWQPRFRANVETRLDPAARARLYSIRPAGTGYGDAADAARQANAVIAPALVASPERAADIIRVIESEAMFNPLVSLLMRDRFLAFDLRPALGRLGVPLLVVQGEADPIGLESVREIETAARGAEVAKLEGAGHWPQLERPERLAAVVEEWAARLGARGG